MMYSVAVIGDEISSHLMIRLAHRSGFHDIACFPAEHSTWRPPVLSLGSNVNRLCTALGLNDALTHTGYEPDREQIRLSPSSYLLAELPLGNFYRQRYGATATNVALDAFQAHVLSDTPQQAASPLTDLERRYDLVVNLENKASENAEATHQLWHAALPHPAPGHNVTWYSDFSVAWQRSTPEETHFFFVSKVDEELTAAHWHTSLQEALEQARPITRFTGHPQPVREHWHEGHLVHAGPACYAPSPLQPEAHLLELEDAWVLSRMMENYEEDISDAIAQYAHYRQPRARKVLRENQSLADQVLGASAARRVKRNLGIAFRTRFLPELAMQRNDWFYQYDCIRGFR